MINITLDGSIVLHKPTTLDLNFVNHTTKIAEMQK